MFPTWWNLLNEWFQLAGLTILAVGGPILLLGGVVGAAVERRDERRGSDL